MLLPTIKGRPVLLPAHDDKELGQPVKHYHIDPRFTKGNKAMIIADEGEEVVMREFADDSAKCPEVEFGVGLYLQLLYLHEGKKLCGTKCPHKGIEVFHNGQCQGHGLRFDDNGYVIGKIAECYLRVPGTKSVSPKGNFEAIKVIERAVQVNAVELVYNDMVLAKSKVGPVGANQGEFIKFAFTIGQNADCPVNPSVTESELEMRTALGGTDVSMRPVQEPDGETT